MRIVRGFWSILLVLAGCGHAPLARLVERSSAEDELYAMATRAVLDEPRIPERYHPSEGGTLFCLGVRDRSLHPAFLARFAAHSARVGPRNACTREQRGLLPDGRVALFLPVRFEAIDWREPERPLVRAWIGVTGPFAKGFALEMSFARDGERWRVGHQSLVFSSCMEQEHLW